MTLMSGCWKYFPLAYLGEGDGIWGEGKIVEIMFLQVGWLNSLPFFSYDTGSVSYVSELVLSFDMFFEVIL
jgi:hypothetical protein